MASIYLMQVTTALLILISRIPFILYMMTALIPSTLISSRMRISITLRSMQRAVYSVLTRILVILKSEHPSLFRISLSLTTVISFLISRRMQKQLLQNSCIISMKILTFQYSISDLRLLPASMQLLRLRRLLLNPLVQMKRLNSVFSIFISKWFTRLSSRLYRSISMSIAA